MNRRVLRRCHLGTGDGDISVGTEYAFGGGVKIFRRAASAGEGEGASVALCMSRAFGK